MATFAKLGIGNVVESVIVVNDDVATSEQVGIDFLNTTLQTNDVWKQTYTDGTRKHYCSPGWTYDTRLDAFIPPRPDPLWVLNETTCLWEDPGPAGDPGAEVRG